MKLDPKAVACPFCGSAPGQPCVRPYLKPMRGSHVGRVRVALKKPPRSRAAQAMSGYDEERGRAIIISTTGGSDV